MLLSSQPPGIYACWVTSKSKSYFINHVTSNGIYCLYDSFADKSMNYRFTNTDIKHSEYAVIFSVDKLNNYHDLKFKYPEIFI